MGPTIHLRSLARAFGIAGLVAAWLSGCASLAPQPGGPPAQPAAAATSAASCGPSFSQVGLASWYGKAFHNKPTASGEPYDMNDLTAAHRTLPLDSVVRVTNLNNGRSVILRINDRGPYVGDRAIDLSRYAAQRLGMKDEGVAPVRIDVFDLRQRDRKAEAAPGARPEATTAARAASVAAP